MSWLRVVSKTISNNIFQMFRENLDLGISSRLKAFEKKCDWYRIKKNNFFASTNFYSCERNVFRINEKKKLICRANKKNPENYQNYLEIPYASEHSRSTFFAFILPKNLQWYTLGCNLFYQGMNDPKPYHCKRISKIY